MATQLGKMPTGGEMGERRPVVVLGGTGHYVQHVVDRLVSRDVPTRVLSRDGERARQTLPRSVEIVEGDVRSDEALTQALDGAGSVVVAVSAFARGHIR
jgi:uncharacterized protein YbjT (DUF2867 family)